MWTAILFLLKAFIILGFIFYIGLGLTNMILILIGKLFLKSMPTLERTYTVIAHFVFIYLYGFFGAYFNELAVAYSGKLKPWFIYGACIIALVTYFRFSRRSLREERLKYAEKFDMESDIAERIHSGTFNPTLFENIITISGLRLYWVSVVAYTIFYFFPNLIQTLYGGLPLTVAKWFL